MPENTIVNECGWRDTVMPTLGLQVVQSEISDLLVRHYV